LWEWPHEPTTPGNFLSVAACETYRFAVTKNPGHLRVERGFLGERTEVLRDPRPHVANVGFGVGPRLELRPPFLAHLLCGAHLFDEPLLYRSRKAVQRREGRGGRLLLLPENAGGCGEGERRQADGAEEMAARERLHGGTPGRGQPTNLPSASG
jgi:hypothetical protein